MDAIRTLLLALALWIPASFASERTPVNISFSINQTLPGPFPDDPAEMRSYCAKIIAENQVLTMRTFGVITSSHPEGRIRTSGEVDRQSAKKNVTTLAATQITVENITALFSHEYSPGKFGAKGLASISDEAVHNTAFWQTGKGGTGIDVHHRDVMGAMFRAEAEELDELSEINETVAAHYLGLAESETPLTETGGLRATVQINFGFYDGLLALSKRQKEKAQELRNQALSLSNVRTHASYPRDRMFEAQGFQLTATRQSDGSFKIVALDVDSSVTTAQLNSRGEIDAKLLSEFIGNVHASIAPEVRAYRVIRFKRLRDWRFAGELVLPDGLRAVNLED